MALTAREKQVRRIARMKAQRRCISCGRQDERTIRGLVKCAACAEKDKASYRKRRERNPEYFEAKNDDQRAWRDQLREKHVCLDCKRQDAYTLSGRPKCAVCAEKDAARHRQWRVANPEKCKANNVAFRERCQGERLCSHCGHPLPFDCSYKTCQMCREKGKQQREARRWKENPNRIKRGTPGVCYMCVKRPVMDGKKVCRQCYDRIVPAAMQNIRKAQEKNGNHIWRKMR